MARERLKLNEESSISTKVRFMTKEIRDILLRKLQYSPKYMSKESNCLIKKGEFEYIPKDVINLENIAIKYVAYYFNDNNEYKAFAKYNKNNLLSETDYERLTVYLRFCIVNDKLPKEFDGVIQHELSHLFQNCNGQTKNETLYNKAVNVAKNSTNEMDRNVAYALYLSFNTEIDAFSNQYYAYLKQNKIEPDVVINNFPRGKGNPYNNFDDYYDYVVSVEEYLKDEHMKELFGLNVEQIFNRLENADKRYKNKMMKVISLYSKEYDNNRMNEHIHRNLSLTVGVRLNFEMDCYKMGIHETESEFD